MAEIERLESNPELAQVTIAGNDPSRGTLYLSKYPTYRVQITSPGDSINPITGQRTKRRGMVAEFRNGRFMNDGSLAEVGASKKQREEVRGMIDRHLQGNFKFGRPGEGDFWLASEQEEIINRRKMEDARATLARLPREEIIAFVESLQKSDQADHDLTAS